MTIQIAQRIGRALGVTSATKTKELDEALRAYVRSVGPGATLPVTGSVPWTNLTGVPATFPPAAHTHPNGDLTGYTAADVLAKLLTVDGAGSTLDADLLDGQSGAFYQSSSNQNAGTLPDARLSANVPLLNGANAWTGAHTFANTISILAAAYFLSNAANGIRFNNAADTINLLTILDNGGLVFHRYATFAYANDAAAAAGGVVLGGIYQNAGALRVRIV